MRANYPGAEVRKFSLIYGAEHANWKLADVLVALAALDLRSEANWSGPSGDYKERRFYAALAEAV
jgi:hypothetical protein